MTILKMDEYLAASKIIDSHHPLVQKVAALLAGTCESQQDIARNCFEWVRDSIWHSHDHQLDPVTCKASDVLLHKTGYCYAKSHLLAALLRANGIPAGFCYQRLSRDGNGPPYCLHGLNAVYLPEFGWCRMDARGNKPGIDAQFSPPLEKLAYRASMKLETDLPGIWPEPLAAVIDVLTRWKTYEDVYDNLPDGEGALRVSVKEIA